MHFLKRNLYRVLIYLILLMGLVSSWIFYSFKEFDTLTFPWQLIGLSDTDKYYQENVSDYLLKNGNLYNVNVVNNGNQKVFTYEGSGLKFKYQENLIIRTSTRDVSGYGSFLFLNEDNKKVCSLGISKGFMVNSPKVLASIKLRHKKGKLRYIKKEGLAYWVNLSETKGADARIFEIFLFKNGEYKLLSFNGDCEKGFIDNAILTVEIDGKGFGNKDNLKEFTISDWKLYRNKTHNFTFKAPKEWEVKKGKNRQLGLIVIEDQKGQEQLSMSITQNKEGQEDFKGLCYEQNSKFCSQKDKGVIDFNAGKSFVYSIEKDKGENRFIILANERLTLSLNNYDSSDVESVDKIINSIEVAPERVKVDSFVGIRELLDGDYKLSNVDIDNWKIFRDERSNFKIKIPETWSCEMTLDQKEVLDGRSTKYSAREWVCLDDELREYDKDYNKKLVEDKESIGEVRKKYNKVIVKIYPSFYEGLGREVRNLSSFDTNSYYLDLQMANVLFPEKGIISKSFENKQLTGLVSFEGHVRSMSGRYDNKIIEIRYLENIEDQSDVFDGILKSFKFIR